MNQKKPFIDQIKDTINNREQIRENLIQNFEMTKKIVELQAKDFYEKTKKSDFFKNKVIPIAESQMADKAIDVLSSKLNLKNTPVMVKIEQFRKDIIDTKVNDARVVTPVEKSGENSQNTTHTTENSDFQNKNSAEN